MVKLIISFECLKVHRYLMCEEALCVSMLFAHTKRIAFVGLFKFRLYIIRGREFPTKTLHKKKFLSSFVELLSLFELF